jgi:UDP-2,4-diacetamido-2,4,6-trideoxy-beta-L-altropyranose hydrolase
MGTGHFMRCLTLADVLQLRGARVLFLSRALPVYLCDMLAAKGMEVDVFESDVLSGIPRDLSHSHWLESSQEQDAADSILALSGQHWDWLVVDHYALDVRWEAQLRVSAGKIMVIDDLADRVHDCDVLLDQNFYADMQTRYIGKVPENCQLLLGPRYALLRDEFRKMRYLVKPRTGVVERILVFFGGVDADNYTRLAISALTELAIKNIHVDVVVGAQHPNRLEIEGVCAAQGYDCHVQTTRMAELMAAADLAIGAGGSATWERCCMGLPALLVAMADNQIDIAKSLDLLGACIYMGAFEEITISSMSNAIADLLSTKGQLSMISGCASSLVDGMGVVRICQCMEC